MVSHEDVLVADHIDDLKSPLGSACGGEGRSKLATEAASSPSSSSGSESAFAVAAEAAVAVAVTETSLDEAASVAAAALDPSPPLPAAAAHRTLPSGEPIAAPVVGLSNSCDSADTKIPPVDRKPRTSFSGVEAPTQISSASVAPTGAPAMGKQQDAAVAQLAALKGQLADGAKREARLTRSLEACQRELAAATSSLATKDGDEASTSKKLADAKQKLAAAGRKESKLDAELKEAAKQLEALKLEAQSEREAAEGAKKKTAEAKAKLAEASAREEQSKKALEALKAQLDVSQKAGARDKDAASEVGAFRRERGRPYHSLMSHIAS